MWKVSSFPQGRDLETPFFAWGIQYLFDAINLYYKLFKNFYGYCGQYCSIKWFVGILVLESPELEEIENCNMDSSLPVFLLPFLQLRYNSYTITFQVYNSMVCSILTKVYNHHHYLKPKHFYYPKRNPIPISSHSSFLPSPVPGNH